MITHIFTVLCETNSHANARVDYSHNMPQHKMVICLPKPPLGLSVRKIAIFLGYTNHIGLNTYIKKRGIKNSHPQHMEV